jgi:hypothetical protein
MDQILNYYIAIAEILGKKKKISEQVNQFYSVIRVVFKALRYKPEGRGFDT